MKNIFILLFLQFYFTSFSQKITDSSAVVMASKEVLIYDDYASSICFPTGNTSKKYSPGDILYLLTFVNCKTSNGDRIAQVYFNGNKYFVRVKGDEFAMVNGKKIPVDELEKFLTDLTAEERFKLNEVSKLKSELYIDYLKIKIYDEINKNAKNGIGIIQAHPVENYSMTDAKFKVLNFSKKTIKYITFSFVGKNAVNDNVGGVITRKGIGPVESLSVGSWDFEAVWLTDIVSSMKLLSVSIIYMDGTTKKAQINNSFWIDEDSYIKFNKLYED